MTIQIYSKALLAKSKPTIPFPRGLELRDHVREMGYKENGHRIYEFTGTDNFGAEWQQRQFFEVNAGRDEEPLVYQPIYDITNDANLPKNVDVNRIGPGGVVFEEVFEGGEVKFSSITSSEFTVPIRHWATGLEYSKDLVIFNSLWNVPLIERQMGIAHNALLNHLHLHPIIDYSYTSANQTAAVTTGATTTEDWLLTLEAAIANSRADATNPRRGPYILLISGSNEFMVERALQRVPQQGVALQANSALSAVRAIVSYDGWTGTRGGLATSYAGVTAGTAYLISQQYRGQDFRSFVKQDLQNEGVEEDISRFMTQTVWDSYLGVYANPAAAVEEVTWPS